MDPFDPVRNEESGRSKRRTSILKVPRKSIVSAETVQQDKVVECAKSSDKRISRRVSFAPANDVLLFAKDVKNTSPTQSPLQELMPAGCGAQNGVQIKVTEIQHFTEIEASLNTPKENFQPKNKASVSGSNFQDRTILFNVDDLDMTQCHTIKITKDTEFLNTSHGFPLGHEEKTMIFDRSMDMTLSQTLNMTCDQDVSFSRKVLPGVVPFTSTMTHGTEFMSCAHTDKENLVPMLNKSVTKKVGEPNLGLVGSDNDLGVTEANPLQCLFPQEIFAEPDRRKSQNSSKDNKFTYEPMEYASKRTANFDTKDDNRSEKTIVFSDGGFMDITQNWTSNIVVAPSVSSNQDKCLKERKSVSTGLTERFLGKQGRAQHQDINLQIGSSYKGLETSLKTTMHQMMNDAEETKEKTVRFSTDDACMDVTSCHTVKISSELSITGEKTTGFSANEAKKDITPCLTGNMARQLVSGSPDLPKKKSSVGSLPTQSVDLDFENFFASLSGQKPKVKASQVNSNKAFMKDQRSTRAVFSMNDSKITAPFEGVETCSDNLDESNTNMDFTEAHTRLITGEEKLYHNVCQADVTSQQRRSVIGPYLNKGMESICKSQTQRNLDDFDGEGFHRERTVRFADDDALMDVTSSHTVHISSDLKPDLPFSEKTVRFDAPMDSTQCHTVNINDLSPPFEDVSLLPKSGKRTVGLTTDNNSKNETKSSMGLKENNSQTDAEDAKLQLHGNGKIFPISGEKTLRFNFDDANMDVTKSHTMMINTEHQLSPDLVILPRSEDKTVQFSSDDGRMEVTQCLTSNIAFETETTRTDLSPVSVNISMDCPPALKKREPAVYTNRRCRSLSGHGLKTALKAKRSVPGGNQTVSSSFGTGKDGINVTQSQVDCREDLNYEMGSFETSKTVVNDKTGFLSVIEEKSMAEISQKEECQENNMTEALHIQMHSQTDSEHHEGSVVSDLSLGAEEGNKVEAISKCKVGIKVQPTYSQTDNRNDEREIEEKIECSPSSVEQTNSDVVHSQKSRRRSLADIQSKMKRISQMLSAPPDNVAVDGNVLVPSLDTELKVDIQEIKSVPIDEPETNVDAGECEHKLNDELEEPHCAPATPFRLETKQLMSRFSMGGVKPKLPRRSKSEEAQTPHSGLSQTAGNSTKTLNIQLQSHGGNLNLNVSDINDEELGSYEDVSETLDTNTMDKEPEMIPSFQEFELDQELQDELFEAEFPLVSQRKRPLPQEENMIEDEKRMKTCKETIILDSQICALESDNITTASTQTTDSSNCSQTASLRCEATFESTSKQSLFESVLEEYASDIQRKFDDGTLTMVEFFKLFHIDFVIHNPRQSVVPGRALSDTESTQLDLSHDRHISLPKQLVYKANVRTLTEQVEGLKVRLHDLDKPLTLINRNLWEEMEHFSEAEFKSFGSKLKERHSLYRKMSKAQSHEMKVLLYSDLIQTNVEEQKKLRGSIEKADAMLKNLDNCVAELEADLAAVEDDVKSYQEELNKVKDALAHNEKSMSELELEKKQSAKKVKRVKDETKNLETHLNMLHTLNEWKLVEITDNSVIYTFLHKTLHLVLLYEESKDNEERRIADVSFKHLLDERSQCHARLVHTLVSQFTQENSLAQKYSTDKHVPQLLHDVSLAVSRCRQLGEELRRLRTWGSLRFDILDIHCSHSEVYIIFSSLKRFTKFEIVFNVRLTSQLCALELKSFKNIIGNTTIQQIEEIIASSTPGPNCLTKMIRNIHRSLLC